MTTISAGSDSDSARTAGGTSQWSKAGRNAAIASVLGWTFDAFDFFLLVFVLGTVAKEFGTSITEVTFAIVLTLATRPIGAFIFGRAADHYGRRPVLIVVIVLYSILELLSAFFSESRVPAVRPRAFWHRPGWRVGCRLGTHDGVHSGLGKRLRLGPAAVRLFRGIPPRRPRVCFSLPNARMAGACSWSVLCRRCCLSS